MTFKIYICNNECLWNINKTFFPEILLNLLIIYIQHVAMVVHQYNMAEGHYLFENLNRPSNVGLTQP